MSVMPRSLRIPGSLWSASIAKAALEGTTVTAVVIEALTEYLNTPLTGR